jgi:ADP-dependent NAD(P)H-hydrate dehydratase
MLLPQLPPRDAHAHKGTFGRAILIGGSRGMSGAIALAGMSALRSGAGLVQVIVPECCSNTVAAFEPCYTSLGLACNGKTLTANVEEVRELCRNATCVAVGPGLGRTPELVDLVTELYTKLPQPVVLDADALYALAQREVPLAFPGGERILTPHPQEFMRLAQTDEQDWLKQAELAEQLAQQFGVTLVLKGHRSLITNSECSTRNTTGNPGMATGGSGDVLTGIITALLCQKLTGFQAAHLGCYVHGLAGDMAVQELGEISLIARDLIEYLPRAWQQFKDSNVLE